MEVEIRLDPALKEPRAVLCAPAMTPEIQAAAAMLAGEAARIPGFRGTEVTPLEPADILRFYGEDREVLAQTAAGTYGVRLRLYELEERLSRRQFVRISHSEIVNLQKVTALDLSLTGTIRMTLGSGAAVSYVSRRYVKKIREVLGV